MDHPSPMAQTRPENSAHAAPRSDHPGVRLPPPLVYVAAIVLGAGIHRLVPLRLLPAGLNDWVAGVLIVAGTVIGGLSVREFRKAQTAIRPDRSAAALVTAGPFRYGRNPMYLALSVLQAGIGIWMNNAWIVLLVIPVLAWINYRVVAREELYLRRSFGHAYLDYERRVRRWL
jgi:protein-S-isoprenylcysteine O-methyltransferase Ste14